MADKAITELVAAEQITASDLFVLQQNDTAKKLPGQVLLNWLTAAADGHGGVKSIEKLSTNVLADTYRITLADTTTFDFVVNNGRGIQSIQKTGTNGLVDTYQIRFNDNTTGSFTVTNGDKGDKGDNVYTWIRYASQKPTASSHSFGELPDAWIGIYAGTSSTAPTDWQAYTWYQWKGEKGDPGDPATLVSSEIRYQVGDSGIIIPSGSWSEAIPPVTPGKYLWTRKVIQFNTGAPITSYSVSRFGIDGTGAVSTVSGVAPDENGNVPLDASSVKALSLSGGTMEGPINMNGQKLRGLNAPTEKTEPVTLGYADENLATRKYADSRNSHNYIDNSDFTQFVAQAGIGGEHGNQAYAGDRWILDSGAVTGEADANGNGYRNIQLNGIIRQIIANPPAEGTVFVEMISGTATAVYENGAVTITSAGGVIKSVDLFEGSFTESNRPAHRSKGYGAELSECRRYFLPLNFGSPLYAYAVKINGENLGIFVPGEPMRIPPSAHADSSIRIFRGAWEGSLYISEIARKNNAYMIYLSNAPEFSAQGDWYLVDGLKSLCSDF